MEHRENGLLYCLDVTRCMFSSGNVTEKARMGALRCRGETVVDLFAGIGYYTLPLLTHAGEQLPSPVTKPSEAALENRLEHHLAHLSMLTGRAVLDDSILGLLLCPAQGFQAFRRFVSSAALP